MITAEAMRPIGLAIKDYYLGDVHAEADVYWDTGRKTSMAISALFRGATDFQVDKIALDNCRGRVLDIGAGAGTHSLYLQQKGFAVCALDITPEACEVMRKRGVKNVVCASFADFKAEPFDTFLILGRSIGMVETISELDDFLLDARRLIKPGGQILISSLDVTKAPKYQDLVYQQENKRGGKYVGEIRVFMEYKGVRGAALRLLHIDIKTLKVHTANCGWTFEVLLEEKDGNYLARLEKKA